MPPYQAALLGAREVGFTVLSMSFSLIAVFIPILLMGGIVGRLFREFSITLSVAVLISLAISLTTTPMMCSRMLRKEEKDVSRRNFLSRASERFFNAVLAGYAASLRWSLRHSLLIVLILFATIALNFYLYGNIKKGFFPQQDTGRLFGFIRADQGISFQAMRTKVADFVEIVRADPAVENVTAFTGGGQRNRGFMFIQLKPIEVRQAGAEQVVTRLRAKLAREPGAILTLAQALDVRAGGRASDSTYQFTLLADEVEALRTWAPRLERELRNVPEIADVLSDQEVRGLQTSLVIDRDTASRLGLGPKQIDSALNLAFGQAIVSTIYRELNQYRVVMEAAPQYWQSPEGLKHINLLTSDKKLIPLSSIARWETTTAPLAINHQSQFVASTLSFNLAEGVSLSQATQAVQAAMARIGMPATIQGSFQGTARQFTASLENQPWLILAALVVIYIVLGVLYESLVHPLTILSTLPSAGVGALLALEGFGRASEWFGVTGKGELNIIAIIGVILLIGIVKKNAIIMIDLAIENQRSRNIAPETAIFEAAQLRFRPIMMTTFAALFGAVPLAVGFGYGSDLRQPLGISIIGGLVLSQILTLYTTPVVYLYLERLRTWGSRRRLARAA
jgi:multidrug efflux pump